jgi:hypothetical protein
LKYTFTVPGNPSGYVAYAKGKNPTNFKAWNYAKLVRRIASENGVPFRRVIKDNGDEDILLNLVADKKCPLHIHTRAYFKNGTHCDPENVHKLVKDAIFYKARGGDKYTAGCYPSPLYDKENPRVEVEITLYLDAYQNKISLREYKRLKVGKAA